MGLNVEGKNIVKKAFAVLVIFVLLVAAMESEVIGRDAGAWFLGIYLVMAALFITDKIKIMIIGFVIASTALLFVVFSYAGVHGIITQTAGLVFFIMWTCIGALVVEYVFIDRAGYFEKSHLYRNYLLLDIAQVFTLMLSAGIMVMAPKLMVPGGPDNKLIMDSFAVVMFLFFISLVIMGVSLYASFSKKGFLEDFARAFYMENENTEATSEEKERFLKTFKRIRMVTYLLFVASLVSIFLVARSKILDSYMDMGYGTNKLANLIIYFAREARIPPLLSQAAKFVFFLIDVWLVFQFIQLVTGKKLKGIFNAIPEKLEKMLKNTEKHVMQAAMIRRCTPAHNPPAGELCGECRALLEYSWERVDNCPIKPFKPVCPLCTQNCFDSDKWAVLAEVYVYKDIS